MPLIEGCSVEASKKNMEKLMDEGYSREQAYAIVVDTALKNKAKCSMSRQEDIEKGNILTSEDK